MSNVIKLNAQAMRTLMELHGLTRSTAAKKIKVSPQTFDRALSGENVSAGFVAGTALAFGVQFDRMFQVVEQRSGKAAA